MVIYRSTLFCYLLMDVTTNNNVSFHYIPSCIYLLKATEHRSNWINKITFLKKKLLSKNKSKQCNDIGFKYFEYQFDVCYVRQASIMGIMDWKRKSLYFHINAYCFRCCFIKYYVSFRSSFHYTINTRIDLHALNGKLCYDINKPIEQHVGVLEFFFSFYSFKA